MRTLAIIFAGLLASPAAATDVALASGLSVRLFDVIDEGALLRYRFVAPEIAEIAYDSLSDDIQTLCDDVVLPALPHEAGEVVISLSSEELPFGDTAPEIVQYFEPFSIEDGRCMWEPF